MLMPRVPAGEYYLRVEPEGDQTDPTDPVPLRVRRDVLSLWPYLIALFLLAVGPAWHRDPRGQLRGQALAGERLRQR